MTICGTVYIFKQKSNHFVVANLVNVGQKMISKALLILTQGRAALMHSLSSKNTHGLTNHKHAESQ